MKNITYTLIVMLAVSCGGSVDNDPIPPVMANEHLPNTNTTVEDFNYISPAGGEGLPTTSDTNNNNKYCTAYNGSDWVSADCSGYCLDRSTGTQCFSSSEACNAFQTGLLSSGLETSNCYFISQWVTPVPISTVPNYSQYDIVFNFGSSCYTVQSEDPEFIDSLPKEIEYTNSLWLYTYLPGETCFEVSDNYSSLDEMNEFEMIRIKSFGNLIVEEYSYSPGCSLCQIIGEN